MLTAALLLVAAIGAVLLRLGWDAREPAQLRLTLAGWAAIGGALAVLTARDGAWGLATGSLPVMLVAFALLGREALASSAPARSARIPDSAPSVRLHAADWRDVGRRVAIFVLTVPVAGAVSLLVGLACAAIARSGGASDVNANVLAMFVTPSLWSVLGITLMLGMRARDMVAPLAVTGLVAAFIFWSFG
ncbi:hypothetical protein [Sphingomonas sp. IW22]|uniref:hypothetical protein n=1 Tax=Sphingomonas sp. IW22 TaxID=3242489 RepID=UPI00351FC1D2